MDRDPRLAATKPYDVRQLQDEFHGFSPRETYVELCRGMGCNPISLVTRMLPGGVGAWDEVTVLDFSTTYVGRKGAGPVVELCCRLPRLRRLSLADNYLSNEAVWYIAQMAIHHPALVELDLSGNEFISWSGAMCLSELVLRNTRICYLGTRRTSIDANTVQGLFVQTRRNAVMMFAAAAVAAGETGVRAKPSEHPSAIHHRALHRFFNQVQINGTVPASFLVDGFNERMHILGRQRELSSVDEAFYEALQARAPMPHLPWEAFIVLLVIDGAQYNEELAVALRGVFEEFNLDPPSAGGQLVEDDGFVAVSELPAMFERLFSTPLSAKDAALLKEPLGLTEDMTMSWDEFFLIMYPRAARVGRKIVGMSQTPLPHVVGPVLHY